MNVAHPDKIWLYKNFNMGTELDIAGEFIYDGIHTLNQMNTVNGMQLTEFKNSNSKYKIKYIVQHLFDFE